MLQTMYRLKAHGKDENVPGPEVPEHRKNQNPKSGAALPATAAPRDPAQRLESTAGYRAQELCFAGGAEFSRQADCGKQAKASG